MLSYSIQRMMTNPIIIIIHLNKLLCPGSFRKQTISRYWSHDLIHDILKTNEYQIG